MHPSCRKSGGEKGILNEVQVVNILNVNLNPLKVWKENTRLEHLHQLCTQISQVFILRCICSNYAQLLILGFI